MNEFQVAAYLRLLDEAIEACERDETWRRGRSEDDIARALYHHAQGLHHARRLLRNFTERPLTFREIEEGVPV